jgi:hypothetical protein
MYKEDTFVCKLIVSKTILYLYLMRIFRPKLGANSHVTESMEMSLIVLQYYKN